MQDEVREKSVALSIKVGKTGGKLTTDLLKWAIRRYLDQSRNPKIHHGKQTVKQLVQQGAGVQNGVTKQFKDQPILKETTISFEAGKIHGIIGMNGSGKTVFLKLLCGLLCPSTGTITVCGKELGKDSDFAPNTGILIETPSFLPYKSGKGNLWDLASIRHKIGKEKIVETMHTVGLDPGMKFQRLRIWRGFPKMIPFPPRLPSPRN